MNIIHRLMITGGGLYLINTLGGLYLGLFSSSFLCKNCSKQFERNNIKEGGRYYNINDIRTMNCGNLHSLPFPLNIFFRQTGNAIIMLFSIIFGIVVLGISGGFKLAMRIRMYIINNPICTCKVCGQNINILENFGFEI